MPALSSIALRYLLWLIGLRTVYAVGVAVFDLPQTIATDVILSAVPLIEIGAHAAKRATRALSLGDWAVVWGVCLAIFAVLMIIGPLAIASFSGIDVAGGQLLRTNLLVVLATAVMMGIFLLIGARIRG